jgi:hypothetical protein
LSITGAHADTLADVRGALRSLAARQPITGGYESHRINAAHGRFYNQDLDASSSAEASVDEQGITIHVSRPLLDQLRNGQTRKQRSGPSAADVSAGHIAELLDYAPALLSMLEAAKIVEERPTILNSAPARLLVLRVPIETPRATGVNVDTKGQMLSLWLGADRVPLAAEKRTSFSVGFLFLKGEGGATDRWTFARRTDHLVVTRHEQESAGSGMGQTSRGTYVETVTVH